MTEHTAELKAIVAAASQDKAFDFNIGIGTILLNIGDKNELGAAEQIQKLRATVIKHLSAVNASSLQSCHNTLLRLQALQEVNMLSRSALTHPDLDQGRTSDMLDKRLAVLGSYMPDKQYILGIRRAVLLARR